jgi:DNA-binding NarL/FixJ family response regulator
MGVNKVRVLLADDHRAVLERVSAMLAEDFEVVGMAENGQDAVDAVGRLDPDVLVIDISMPVLDGLMAAARLHRAGCRTRVVFLTIHSDQDFVAAAFSAGASGYVTKANVGSDLVPAIRQVVGGNTFVSKPLRGYVHQLPQETGSPGNKT